jgi:hypothetical protein
MLQTVYVDEALIGSVVSEWFKRFKDRREDLHADTISRLPSYPQNADTIANVRDMVTRDRRWALRMMADELNVNKETILQILHEDLQKRKIYAKFVPQRFADGQKQQRETRIMPKLYPDLSRQSQFLDYIFLFPQVKTTLKGKSFQNVSDIKEYDVTGLNLVHLEAFADGFQKLFKLFNKYIKVG